MQGSEEKVAVRRRWNGAQSTLVPVGDLWDFHFQNDSGGVCGAFPRAFLCARVWCDKVDGGALGHFCREGPPPHDFVVCILPNDNAGPLYERLRALAHR